MLAWRCQYPFLCKFVANLLKLPRKGRIAQGCDADLLVVDQANRIDGVMARGAWQVKHGRQLVTGLFEE